MQSITTAYPLTRAHGHPMTPRSASGGSIIRGGGWSSYVPALTQAFRCCCRLRPWHRLVRCIIFLVASGICIRQVLPLKVPLCLFTTASLSSIAGMSFTLPRQLCWHTVAFVDVEHLLCKCSRQSLRACLELLCNCVRPDPNPRITLCECTFLGT